MSAEKVLLIHHRIAIQEVIQAGFDYIADWKISVYDSVQSMLIKITINHPDLIILDFDFSEMRGVEILKMIRNYLCCYSPVVVFSGQLLTTEEQAILSELGVLKVIYQPSP
ncbi:MAG TPA: response regulator [Kamptonema sp.]|nr:response regulator [Kamptonema sp.]